MIIDIHTHIFPERIAARSIAILEENAGIKASTNGMLDGLKASAIDAGVDYSIVMPVATKPEQFDNVNEYAAWLNENSTNDKYKIMSFGGIHPDTPDYKKKLKRVKELGLKGIKLHPDYQKTMIDDIKYMNIIEEASALGLVVLVHAGVDIGLPDPVHCAPDRARKVIDAIHPKNFILAHLGGYGLWDMVEEYLVGQDVYFDTAFLTKKGVSGEILPRINEEQFVRIIKTHGADKILFGSDSPWTSQKDSVEFIKRQAITEEEKKLILGENANRILQLA